MALNTPTGITPLAFERMIQGAGGAYLKLDLKGGESAEEVSEELQAATLDGRVLGATRGGFNFDYNFDVTDIEVDGKLFPFKGSTQMTKMNAQVETTLLEWSPGQLKRVFGNSEYLPDSQSMKFRMQFTNDSYIDEVWFVFFLIGGGYVAHKLTNVLNTAGSSPQSGNEDQAELPVTFVGHQGSLTDAQYGPVEIYWFLPEGKMIDPDTLMIVDKVSGGSGASGQSAALKSGSAGSASKSSAASTVTTGK